MCTRGGIASYGYRVVSVGGEAVEADVLKTWEASGNRDDIYTGVGVGMGYGPDCGLGAGCGTGDIDLSKYAGKVVNVEVFAITNAGYEIVVASIDNVTVPEAAPAE